jgi:hypothetical protein
MEITKDKALIVAFHLGHDFNTPFVCVSDDIR